MDAEDVVELLGLDPLPLEGGTWAGTWRDEHGSSIYYLMSPTGFSALHRLNRTELWHHYAGAPAEMLLLHPDGSTDSPLLGDDLLAGQRPFVPVPAGTWMGASTTGAWSLVGTTMAPPYDPDGFELGSQEDLVASYPAVGERIVSLVRPVQP